MTEQRPTKQSDDWRMMNRWQQMIIYTICVLDELKERGLIVGGRYRGSAEAHEQYKQMKADGFSMTEEETHMVMAFIQKQCAADETSDER